MAGRRISDGSPSRQRVVIGALAVATVVLGGDAAASAVPSPATAQAAPDAPTVEHTPVGPDGSTNPTVSGDGRFVVFEGDSSGDANRTTVFMSDRTSGDVVELSPLPSGLRSGATLHPVISGDGCAVAVVTELQLDVFRDDDNGDRWDVYRSRLPQCGGSIGNWELVSTKMTDAGGVARDDVVVAPPSVSRSGTTVAYAHAATHLFDAAGVTTISLVDVTVPIDDVTRSRFVAGSPADSANDVYVHRGLDQPAVSADGRYVTYRSDATSDSAVPNWATGPTEGGPAAPQVFVWDTRDSDPFSAVTMLSVRPDGTPSSGSGSPDISRDGTVIAFTSSDSALTAAVSPACDAECPSQVYVVDRDGDVDGAVDTGDDVSIDVRIVSARQTDGGLVAGTAPSNQPSLSGDGHLLAFVTKATDLQLIEVPGTGSGDDGDLLLAELRTGRLSRLTEATGGVLATPGVHAHPNISDTGRTVVFDTAAAQALGDDDVVAAGRQVVVRSSDPVLSLPDVDIGTTLVNQRSDEWYVAVVNDGPSSFRPASISVSDSRFDISTESPQNTCALAVTVPSGGSCTVALSFTPTGAGGVSARLTIAEDGFGAVAVSARLEGSGGQPALRIDPGGADLGILPVGEASTEFQFDLGNIGAGWTEVTSFEVTGAHASDFTVTSNSCTDRPLNPRATCSVGVVFSPSDAGRRTALLEVGEVNGRYTTVVLGGDGRYQPVIVLSDQLVEAGDAILATGRRYPANTEVTVVFGDTADDAVVVTTDEAGSFEVSVPVDQNTRAGDRNVVVQTATGAAASAPVEVVQDEQLFVGMPGFGLG